MKRLLISAALAGALIFTSGTQQHAQANDGTIGTIIGAVGGGLLGSAMGKGKGRVVATAAGTVIGAVLGHEIATADKYEPPKRRVVYRDPPTPKVVYKKHKPRKKYKKWKRVAVYDGDVLVCNKNGKRCHWYD